MSPFAEDEEMVPLEDAAQRFGVDVRTVIDWCHKGNLPAMRISGSWRVRRTALELFLETHERPNTLVGQLYAFLRVPDNLLAVTQTTATTSTPPSSRREKREADSWSSTTARDRGGPPWMSCAPNWSAGS